LVVGLCQNNRNQHQLLTVHIKDMSQTQQIIPTVRPCRIDSATTRDPVVKSVNELQALLDKLLNQGELLIKWHRKIKNKGNANYVAA
jgi:hypothetical protein